MENAQNRGDCKKLFRLVNNLARKYSKPISGTILDKRDQVIKSKEQLHDRWCEYFAELLNRNPPQATQAIPQHKLPLTHNISEEPPSLDEIQKAIKCLKSGRAPGVDGLPPDLFKTDNPSLIQDLHHLYTKIWADEKIPTDWQTAIIIPIFKKGEKRNCKNYRGISLLAIAYKLMERILLNRILSIREMFTRENQAGFRPGRSCTDQIFSLRQIIELRHEFRQPTVVAFLDFTAAFDSVDRGTIWSLLKMEGIPNKLVNLCASMYENTNCRVRAYGEDGHAFATKTGVRQGGILSPCLFNIAIDHVLKKALDDNPLGITIYPSQRSITDLTFADDIAVLAESMDSTQIMVDHIIHMAASVGLKLNCQKSKYMTANIDPINPNSSLTIENEPMEQVT